MGVDLDGMAMALRTWEFAQRTLDDQRTKAWEANAAKRFMEACGLGAMRLQPRRPEL